MNKVSIFILVLILPLLASGQSKEDLIGAWERALNGNQQTLVFADGYWSFTEFNVDDKIFVGTIGGSFELSGSEFLYVEEYNTLSGTGKIKPLMGKVHVNAKKLEIGSSKWNRVDNGEPGSLQGAWLITGRKRDGVMTAITPGARKTMKILSGTRFQWIAYNSETMDFMGTGGGNYTTTDGKYTENIEFFSRDSTRVGASLAFNFELNDSAWHHSGKSSKGHPMHEIWSLRE